jgi:hypothetical protein
MPPAFLPALETPEVLAYRHAYQAHRKGEARGSKDKWLSAWAPTRGARGGAGAAADATSTLAPLGDAVDRWLARRDTTTRTNARLVSRATLPEGLGAASEAAARRFQGLALFAGSALAGGIATFCTHPLDTMLVRRQCGQAGGLLAAGLWRGVVPATAGGFLFFGQMQFTYGLLVGAGLGPAAAGAASGLGEALLRGPIESIKNLRQTGCVIANSGLSRLLVKGTAAMACREIPGNAVYFAAFATAMEAQKRGPDTFAGNAIAGACAGTAWALLLHPVDALRVQYVTDKPLQLTYRGIGPAIVRTSMSATVYFAMLGQIRRWYEGLDDCC